MNPLRIALQFLTRLPVKVTDYNATDTKSALYWYGTVGLIIGCLLHLFYNSASWLFPNLSNSILAALIVALWVLLTGALHLDGLADSADAWMGAKDKDSALRIMKDPTSGPGGVTAILLDLLIKFACVQTLLAHDSSALIYIPALARSFMPILFLQTAYSGAQGLGQPFSEGINFKPTAVQLLLLVMLAFCIQGMSLFVVLIMMTLAYWWARNIMLQRIDGTTGDTAGALIELLEMTALLAVCLTLT